MKIHPTAVIDKNAEIAEDVEIGPFSIIEEGVKIASGVRISSHAHILKFTEVGEDTVIHTGAVLGDKPQDVAFQNKETYLKIGRRNIIREYATLHRGTKEGSSTIIGDDNFLMVNSHLGHNCHIGNRVIIANGALLAGYVTVGDSAFISGNVVIHQFTRIGKLAMIGGFSGVNKDVPPYMTVRGPSIVRAINLVGLRRAKMPRDEIKEIKKAFEILYRSDMNTETALKEMAKISDSNAVSEIIGFVKESKRGICKGRDNVDVFEGGQDGEERPEA